MKNLLLHILFLLCLFFLSACEYRADRFDEHVITQQENHFNLYRNVRLEVLDELNQREDTPASPCRETLNAMLSGKASVSADDNNYTVISIQFNRTPPMVQGFRDECGKKERRLLFSVPLVRNNALLLRTEECGIQTFQILLSLRYDTLFPIILKNNYELFVLTLRHDAKHKTWEIAEFKEVTNGKKDAVQGVFSRNGALIAYVEDDRERNSELIIINRDGTDRRVVSKDGMLPCFLDNDELLFVSNSGTFGDFHIYNPRNGKIRDATDPEIAQILRSMPYGALREFYLRFGKGVTPEKMPGKMQTFRQLFEFGFRNSPLILQSYYEYLAVKARNTQNLFDIGPDFFMGADYLVTSNILFDAPNDPFYVIGDRIGNDNFIRFLTGFSIPVIPNLPLRWARRYYDDWREQYGRASILKAVNEYTGRITRLAFDYWQSEDELVCIGYKLQKNAMQLRRFRLQYEHGYGTAERVIFAENIAAALTSEQNVAVERMIWCQTELAALIGINPEEAVRLYKDPEIISKLESVHTCFSPEWFQAQARINRQELRQIDALIQQDAATRDMGPEQTRIDAVRIRITYGVGFIDWRRLVDDFLLFGVGCAIPLRLPKFFESYYQDYGNRIQALRMQKYLLEGVLVGEVLSAWTDYSTANGRAAHRAKRLETIREQARLIGLLQKHGTREMMPPERDSDEYAAELETLTELNTANVSQYERLRRLSKLYEAAGRSDVLLRKTIAALDAPTGAEINPRKFVSGRGIYLWTAPELIRTRDARARFFQVCKDNGIDLVYCYFSMKKDRVPFLRKYEPEYALFIEECHRRRIRVWALLGEQEWLFPGQREDMRTLLDSYMAFNRGRAERGEVGFDGISLDVEPHSVPGWHSGKRQELIENYLSLLDETAKKTGRVFLNVAVPYTYSGIPVDGKNNDLLSAVAERCGSLTVMVYRDSAAGVLEKAAPVLSRSDMKTSIRIAVETHEVAECGVSFFGMEKAVFSDVLNGLAGSFSEYRNFSGMVVNDYAGFIEMR